MVKGVNFSELRDAGDPVELARLYDAEGADELTFLDISASHEGRATTMEVVSRCAEEVFIPLTVGGGVALRRRRRPAAARGRRQGRGQHRRDPPARAGRRDRRPVRQPGAGAVGRRPPGAAGTDSGLRGHHPRRPPSPPGSTPSRGPARAAELGAGEILLNAMDADGTKDGFDLELIAAVRREVHDPGHRQRRSGRARALPARGRRRRRRRARRHRLPLRHAADRRGQAGPGGGRPPGACLGDSRQPRPTGRAS